MPQLVRLGDICTGHCFSPRPNVGASGNVITNGLGSHRVGDPWDVHCCGPVCHAGTQATGSPNVIINGMAVARVGDSIDCGSSNATGSGNVMVN